MSGAYVPVADGERLVVGTPYRAKLRLRAPYTIENIERIEARWRQLTGAGAHFALDSIKAAYPSKDGTWTVTIEYHVREGSGLVLLDNFATLAQNVVAFVIGTAALILTTVEKFVVDTVSGVVGAGMGPVNAILNPGVLVLAVVGIYLITRRS